MSTVRGRPSKYFTAKNVENAMKPNAGQYNRAVLVLCTPMAGTGLQKRNLCALCVLCG
jgi:hypothetical protein